MIPISDSPRARTIPWVNYGIILVNFLVFFWMLSLSNEAPASNSEAVRAFSHQTNGVCYQFETAPTPLDSFACKWSFQPKEFFDDFAGRSDVPRPDRPAIFISIITALFLHIGWFHILGNMLFLWVFGDNVEDRLGHAGYLVFYLLAGIVAMLVQGMIDTSSVVPVLGASGAVAGVLGAYLVYHPRATVRGVIPFFPLIFIPLPVPAFVMIGIWFVQNLLSGIASISDVSAPDTSVAFFAHIGGFIFGVLTSGLLLRSLGRRPPSRRSG